VFTTNANDLLISLDSADIFIGLAVFLDDSIPFFSIFYLYLNMCIMSKDSNERKYNTSEERLLERIQDNIYNIQDPKKGINESIESVKKYQKRVGVESELLIFLENTKDNKKLLSSLKNDYNIKIRFRGYDKDVTVDNWISAYTIKNSPIYRPKTTSGKKSLFSSLKSRFTGASKRGGRYKKRTRKQRRR